MFRQIDVNAEDQYPSRQTADESVIFRKCPVAQSENGWLGNYVAAGYHLHRRFNDIDYSELVDIATQYGDGDGVLLNKEPDSDQIRSILGVHRIFEFGDIVDKCERLAAEVLGDDIYLHQSRINFKYPGGSGWHAHSDFETWHTQDGMPRMECCTIMLALTDNDESNGPIEMLSHSHNYYFSCAKQEHTGADDEFSNQTEGLPSDEIVRQYLGSESAYIPMFCKAGDALVFDCNTLHRSFSNFGDTNRTNLYLVYNKVSNMLQQSNRTRPKQMAEDFIKP